MTESNESTVVESTQVIEGYLINFAKAGHGKQNLLCLSGAIGCWSTDFAEVIQGYDHSKFTIVAWDPPGYGKSRPPDRNFAHGINTRDAQKAHMLMKRLKLLPYSILGWSDGGVTALCMAYQQRATEHIQRIVIWGTTAYINEAQTKVYKAMKDPMNWAEKKRKPYLELYGEEYFNKSWKKHIDSRLEIYNRYHGDKCQKILPDIPQPVLILHGGRDVFVTDEHPRYIQTTLPDARIKVNEQGTHDLHNDQFEWFKEQVESFVLSEEEQSHQK